MEQGMERASVIAGTSGATVELTPSGAVKYAAAPALWPRLRAQAQYMAHVGVPFVKVLGIAEGRYWMELLQPLRNRDNVAVLLCAAKASLSALWATPRAFNHDWRQQHINYVRELCALHRLPGLFGLLNRDWNTIASWSHSAVATHGDATLDNLLVSEDGQLRWIDPIPANYTVPPLRAVDLGKLLQSSDGYERRKYGAAAWGGACDWSPVLDNEDAETCTAALYFRAVAYLRMLRYVTGDNLVYAKEALQCYSSLT
jgi:hypothetical protein